MMADIGKDGKNLFQSIFHPTREKNNKPTQSADCLIVNKPDGDDGNKVVGEETPQDHTINSIDHPLKDNEPIANGETTDLRSLIVSHSETEVLNGVAYARSSDANEHQPSASETETETAKKCVNTEQIDNLTCSSTQDQPDCSKGNSGCALIGLKTAPEQVSGKVRRGIRFPTDSCISGYHEPPDPWKNASACTPDEIIAAYKQSCETNNTKPSAKIIQQLNQLNSTLGKREELLTLKGEKLDQRQCETIEEILRRVQFKLLDLEACHLDDETAQALFDMIEYYESACQLNISFNKNISVRGWQSCSRLVRRTPCLTYLDMRNCEMDERTIPLFGRALKLGCHLTILHMENMSLAGKTLIILVAALKMNETLQELFLAENKLMPSDGIHLGHLLRYNHKLGLLDLRNNHLQDDGVSHICEGLQEQTGHHGLGLRTLVLWNNQINYQAMPTLGKALALSETLETLNIGHNAITNEGAHLLKDGLLKTTSLLRLGLQGTRISDEGAVALAEYIADSTILLRIDLRDNDIKTGGLMALSHAMRVNTSVTRIDLDKDPKKESYMKDYAEQQGRLLRDILTFQQRNIETALQREEELRAELERKAQEAQRRREEGESNEKCIEGEKAKEMEGAEGSEEDGKEEGVEGEKESPPECAPVVEAFTMIDKSEVSDGSSSPPQPLSSSSHQRPSHLFEHTPVRAQESLDSPMPSSSEIKESMLESDPCDEQSPGKQQPNIQLEAPPPEMILSPQYAPRNMARKIFSVSLVSESSGDASGTSSSSSGVQDIDPLTSTSAIPVAPSAIPISSSVCGAGLPLASPSDSLAGTSLANSLANVVVTDMLPLSSSSSTSGPSADGGSAPSPEVENLNIEASATSTTSSHNPTESVPTSACSEDNILVKVQQPVVDDSESTNSSNNTDSPPQPLVDPSTSAVMPEPTIDSASPVATLGADKPVESDTVGEPGVLLPTLPLEPISLQGSGDNVPVIKSNPGAPGDHQTLSGATFCVSQLTDSIDSSQLAVLTTSQSEGDTTGLTVSINSDSPSVFNAEEAVGSNANLPSTTTMQSDSQEEELSSPTDSQQELSSPNADQADDGYEAWLAVGDDTTYSSDSTQRVQPSQPDFFTTLSMNGLTQELASALTSLDGSQMSPELTTSPGEDWQGSDA